VDLPRELANLSLKRRLEERERIRARDKQRRLRAKLKEKYKARLLKEQAKLQLKLETKFGKQLKLILENHITEVNQLREQIRRLSEKPTVVPARRRRRTRTSKRYRKELLDKLYNAKTERVAKGTAVLSELFPDAPIRPR